MSAATTPTRQGQQTVLARLQGLFPHSPSTTTPTSSEPPLTTPDANHSPKFLKIRILTWNMHDSVPKGDLEELFGKVQQYTPPACGASSFPEFTADESHPYHLVIVAGQECPSLSGIPMGFGAGFKLLDKDHVDKDRPESIRSKKIPEDEALAGWTAMVEDWLCHAGACNTRLGSPTTSDISAPKPLSPRLSLKEKKGPYQMLTKERMMGIYLAVYIHRDLRSHVNGVSKSAVTAGLIGGRLGNKGAVGISLKIDTTSFLFLNCHLAAHEGKVHHRLANLAKIKSELAVDDFLPAGDPRIMAEDLTDRFDFTFLFGDLNFRLDISRLHADWLISRQEYAQALAFDQLLSVMQNGEAFVGFHEAPIDFAPTFKYDVLRTLKRPKRHASRLDRWKHQDKPHKLVEVEEKDHDDDQDEREHDDDGDEDEDNQGENASLASSMWTSMHSRPATDGDEDFFDSTTLTTPGSKVSLTVAAHKAKAKWMTLLSPSSPSSPSKWLKARHDVFSPIRRHTKMSKSLADFSEKVETDDKRASSLECETEKLLKPPPLGRASSARSFATSEDEDARPCYSDKGVYDSSNKKRVPSWCDRILWKTTVEPDPEPDLLAIDASTRGRSKVGQFFANAFRPLSARVRRESWASSVTSVANSIAPNPTSPQSEPPELQSNAPFSRFVYPHNPRSTSPVGVVLSQTKSQDNISTAVKPYLPRRASNELDARIRRSTSSVSSSSSKVEASPRARASTVGGFVSAPPVIKDSIHQPPTPSRWRFFNPFHNSGTASSTNIPQELPPVTPNPEVRRKGDIVCTSYDTLDDGGMRRLEGRSDHRPVIGTYAVYI